MVKTRLFLRDGNRLLFRRDGDWLVLMPDGRAHLAMMVFPRWRPHRHYRDTVTPIKVRFSFFRWRLTNALIEARLAFRDLFDDPWGRQDQSNGPTLWP